MSRAEITLRGKTFTLACAPGQEERLQDLGDKLNSRVNEIAETVGDLGDLRLLVAAGISLLNDLDEIKAGVDFGDNDLEARIVRLEREAAAALVDAASRIEAIAHRVEQAS